MDVSQVNQINYLDSMFGSLAKTDVIFMYNFIRECWVWCGIAAVEWFNRDVLLSIFVGMNI